MPLIDPRLIEQARSSLEKRAIVVWPSLGAGVGFAKAPRGHGLKGAIRGAGVGLTTGLGIPLGGLVGAGTGGILGGLGGGLVGGGASAIGQLLDRGNIDPAVLGAHAGGGAALGGGLGMIGGSVAGAVTGGREGFDIGKRYIWRRPWDRELPHGVSGADDDDDDKGGRKKAASFAVRLGMLVANREVSQWR